MGVWALPQTVKQAKELQKLVAKPLSPKVATDKLYNLLGDDDLFDLIEAEEEKFGNDCDVRILVELSLSKFLSEKENATKPWEKEAFKICQNICKSIEELHIPY
ncbi:MAG: hypothetical protein KGP29_02630 [Proteobacteria bacterium]|nr:hypothetical protein [Pseudomonadota bacterium]